MKAVNYRFLAAILVSAFLLAGVIAVVHRVQSRRNAPYYLEKARTARDEKRLGEAFELFGHYLQLAPTDSEALSEYALVATEVAKLAQPPDPGKYGLAYGLLENVLRAEPDRANQAELRRELAQVAMQLGRYNDALEQIEKHLLPSEPKDWRLWAIRANCQARQGHEALAVESLQLAVLNAPDQVDNYYFLARLQKRLEDRGERKEESGKADDTIQRMVALNPKSARAYVLRATYVEELAAGADTEPSAARWEQAWRDVERAIELAPDDLEARYLATRLALRREQYDVARQHIQRAIDLGPWNFQFYLMAAEVEIQSQAMDKAIERLQAGLVRLPDQPRLLWSLALVYVEMRNVDAATQVIQRLRSLPADSGMAPARAKARVDYLQGRVEYMLGRWSAASQSLERATAGLSEEKSLRDAEYWLGRCYEQFGAVDRQLAAYRRAARTDPTWLPARLSVAMTLASIGRMDEAIEEQRALMQLPRAPEAGWLQLAQWRIQRNASLEPAQRDWQQAESDLDRAAELMPGAAEVALLRAEILVLQDRLPDAEKLLTKARDAAADQPIFWTALARVAQRRRDWDRVEQVLDEAQRKLGDVVTLRMARARYYLDRYAEKAGPQLRALTEKLDHFSPREQASLCGEVAAAMLQLEDLDTTRQLCQRVAKLEPRNLQIRLLAFEVAARTKDVAAMESILTAVGEIEGKGAIWHVGMAIQAKLAAEQGDTKAQLEKSLSHLAEARQLNAWWSRIPALMAEVYDRLGREDGALQAYLDAISRGDRNPASIHRAVQLLYKRQDNEGVEKLIRQLAAQPNLLTSEASRMASELLLRRADFQQAMQMARDTAAQSKDYQDHIWLGQVLVVAAQEDVAQRRSADLKAKLDEAEKSLRHAIELAPGAALPWTAWIRFLTQAGRTDEAAKAVAEAEQKIPEAQRAAALAQCYEAMGKLDEAAKRYEALLGQQPDNLALVQQVVQFYFKYGKLRAAQPHLEKLVGAESKADEVTKVWARRQLATVLAAEGNLAQRKRALSLVNENLARDAASPEDRRIKAVLLAADAKRPSRQEAIRILEQLLQDTQAPMPNEYESRFLLAQLYLEEKTDKGWLLASAQMRTILASRGRDARYVAGYTRALLDRKEVTEAERWLLRLEELAPDDFNTVRLRAESLFLSGKSEGAISRLRAFLGKSGQAPDRAPMLLSAAETFRGFARQLTDPARKADVARLQREASVCLDEALTLAEEIAGQSTVEEIVGFSSHVASLGLATPEQLGRLERILLPALEKHGRRIPLLLVVADLRTAQQHFDDVETLYREVLQQEPANVVALNNLAVLLALRGKQLDEANQLIAKAIETTGPEPTLLDSRATVLAARNQTEEALRDLESALDASPRPARYFHQAEILSRLGNQEAAARALAKAVETGLTAESLHPLERPSYGKLIQQYARTPQSRT